MKNESNYTSYARPTIIYAGLLFLFFEISGFRWFVLIKVDACKDVIEYSKFLFINFLYAWSAFVGVYNFARTYDKFGSKGKLNDVNISLNESGYTKKARPSVIYIGLFFILCEIIGFRWIIFEIFDINLSSPDLLQKKELLLNGTKEIIQLFMTCWTALVAQYGGCRTADKYVIKPKEVSIKG